MANDDVISKYNDDVNGDWLKDRNYDNGENQYYRYDAGIPGSPIPGRIPGINDNNDRNNELILQR